jgi:hypothetical protein
VKENTRPKLPENLNEGIKDIVRRCWMEKAEKRPEIGEIVAGLETLLKGTDIDHSSDSE